MKRFMIAAAAFLAVSAARDASAQIFLSPFVGTTLTSPSTRGNTSKPGFGLAFGSLGNIVGAETEIAYFPQVLDNSANALAKNRVFTFSADTLIGPTIGRVKPYFAIGAGDLHLNVTSLSSVLIPTPASFSSDYFMFNLGGGVMGFFTRHLGVRADLRYFRAYGFKIADLQSTAGNSAGITLDRFDFWRASIGLAAKF